MKSFLFILALLSIACQNTPETTGVQKSNPQRKAHIAHAVHIAKKYRLVPNSQRELTARLTYSNDGLLNEEITYRAGQPTGTVTYKYYADFTVHTITKNGKPHLCRLLQDGGRTVVEETFLLHDTLRTVYTNDTQGRPLRATTSTSGVIRSQNIYTWSVTGDTLHMKQKNPAGAREFVQVLHEGLVIKEQRFADGTEVYFEENEYSNEGLPTFQKRIDKAGCTFTTRFTYEAGLLKSEIKSYTCEGQTGSTEFIWEYERFE